MRVSDHTKAKGTRRIDCSRFDVCAAICLLLLSVGCGAEKKVEVLNRLPCVDRLTVVKMEPLHILVVTSEGSGGVVIKNLNRPKEPKEISTSVDVFVGQTFVVHQGRTGYDFTLKGETDGLIEFSTRIVENRGVPQIRIQAVRPYGSVK